MQKMYEGIIFIRPVLSEEEINKVVEKIKSYITESKGDILEEKPAEKRNLPYEIKKFNDGYHYYVRFTLEAASVASLSEKLRLTEEIIRYMISLAVEGPKEEKPEEEAAPPAEPEAGEAGEKAETAEGS